MTDFLLELLSEEIPARMQAAARNDFARLFAQELDELGVTAEAIDVWSTPRRLALVARGLPTETQAASEEIKGPRTSAPCARSDCRTSSFRSATESGSRSSRNRDGLCATCWDRLSSGS